METSILNGLVCEWQLAVDYLRPALRARMRLPGFEIDAATGHWGMWRRDRRTIVLSGRLISDFPWGSIREVLLHEMAHQLTDECFGGDLTPHGEEFQEACRLLSADPRASSESPSIHERLDANAEDGEDRIMTRVRKLLAMAHGGGCNEADVAMAKVHELMARHNVSMLQAGGRKPVFESMTLGEPVLRFHAEEYHMMSLLRDFYFVGTVVIPAYVVCRARMGHVLEVSGAVPNLKMARYVHAFLHRTVDEQWSQLVGNLRNSRRRKTDFAAGLIHGFSERLSGQEESLRSAVGYTTALVAQGKHEVDAYLKTRYARLHHIQRRGRVVDEGVTAAGREVGRRTVLSKPVESGSSRRGLLLGGG